MVEAPARGDVVWTNFDPQLGHEQAGTRPALVLSPLKYNAKSGLMICAPVTRRSKGYPFEVRIPLGYAVRGVILSDHVKSFDWRERGVEYICQLPETIVEDVFARITVLLFD